MIDALRKAPYYDDYDSSKQYTQLLAIPGRVAQAREFTQIQSTIKDIIRSIGDSILKDGNIIEGCQVLTFTDAEGIRRARVTSGKVYLSGMVLPVSETVVAIEGVGSETVGVKLVEEIITHDGAGGDPTLRDPAQGYANYNQPGCDRLKSYTIVVANDPDSSIIASLIDGELAVEKYAPEYDTMTQTLARRTYDESGSYIVDGLNVRVEANAKDDNTFTVVVESGKAYVLGYELKIPVPRRLTLPRSLETTQITVRHLKYNGHAIQISNTPYIKSVVSVLGDRRRTINQRISSNTDRVLFEDMGVSNIVSVKQGDTSFTVGDVSSGDCYLEVDNDNRSYLRWRGTSNFPEINRDYSVVYDYQHTFIQGTDYKLYHDSATDSQSIAWISGGLTPTVGSAMVITYDLYLARKDLVYIDQYGNIDVAIGIPSTYGFEVKPEAPINTLPLAYISSPPSGDTSMNANLRINIANVGLTRFTMNDIQRLLDRIRTIEYDQTILSLNEEAKQYDTGVLDKKGILTDPLIDLSKIDIYYNLHEGQPLDEDKPTYDAAIDLIDNLCYLPIDTKTYDAVYSSSSSSKKVGRTATLSKTGEEVVLSQMNATKSFLVNPYSMFPQMPEISISPSVDVWIEDSIVEVPVSQSTSAIVSQSTRNIDNYVASLWWGSSSTSSTETTAIGTQVERFTNESVIAEKAVTHIRVRDIEVEGSHYPARLDNIKCYFDGIEAPLTPLGSTIAGTASGSIKADDNGYFKAKFRIPNKVLTGIREVRLESNIEIDGYMNSAFALYQASGTARTIQRTVTTLTTVLLNRVTTVTTTHFIDPVGQTFVLDRMTLVSGIDLYFEDKPKGNTPITCDIREVVNGSITSTVYAHKTLSASQVKVSSDSRVATRFEFDAPVLLEENKEYAFVVRSTSPSYRLWVAELGERDILTSEPVLSNPYLIGVMMSSSNNSSWTTHQTSDIKFRLIADTYSKSAEVLFNNIASAKKFCRIFLLAESMIPNGTSVSWEYSLDAGKTYASITPYSMITMNNLASSIVLKAIMTRNSNSHLSPIIALDSVGAVLSSYDNSKPGWYITRAVTNLSPYTTVDVMLDTYTYNSGTGIEVWVENPVDGLVRADFQSDAPTNSILNYNWESRTYRAKVTEATECRILVKMTSNLAYTTPAFRRLRAIFS